MERYQLHDSAPLMLDKLEAKGQFPPWDEDLANKLLQDYNGGGRQREPRGTSPFSVLSRDTILT